MRRHGHHVAPCKEAARTTCALINSKEKPSYKRDVQTIVRKCTALFKNAESYLGAESKVERNWMATWLKYSLSLSGYLSASFL